MTFLFPQVILVKVKGETIRKGFTGRDYRDGEVFWWVMWSGVSVCTFASATVESTDTDLYDSGVHGSDLIGK